MLALQQNVFRYSYEIPYQFYITSSLIVFQRRIRDLGAVYALNVYSLECIQEIKYLISNFRSNCINLILVIDIVNTAFEILISQLLVER